MSENGTKFDEAAFDAAVAKPNGWSGVADPVAEIRRMRDGGVAQETPKLEQCGNAAALRAALRESTAILAVVHGGEYSGEIDMQIDKNTEALMAPARNCDVIDPTCDLKDARQKQGRRASPERSREMIPPPHTHTTTDSCRRDLERHRTASDLRHALRQVRQNHLGDLLEARK